jgi:hypothetical protein
VLPGEYVFGLIVKEICEFLPGKGLVRNLLLEFCWQALKENPFYCYGKIHKRLRVVRFLSLLFVLTQKVTKKSRRLDAVLSFSSKFSSAESPVGRVI